MKHLAYLIALVSVTLSGCANVATSKSVKASGPDVSGVVAATAVSEIAASQAIVVNYTVGSPVSVKYTVPESLAPYLDITCKNGELKCRFKDGIDLRMGDRHVTVDVVAPAVCDFEASSAAAINVSGVLKVAKLEVDAESAATVRIASVTASEADIDASNAGSVVVNQLSAHAVSIDASGSSNITVTGRMDTADVESSSAARVTLSGECGVIDAEASSAATIDAADAKIGTGRLEASSGGSIKVSAATQAPYKTEKSSGGSITIR